LYYRPISLTDFITVLQKQEAGDLAPQVLHAAPPMVAIQA
jgi:hypothetical protein